MYSDFERCCLIRRRMCNHAGSPTLAPGVIARRGQIIAPVLLIVQALDHLDRQHLDNSPPGRNGIPSVVPLHRVQVEKPVAVNTRSPIGVSINRRAYSDVIGLSRINVRPAHRHALETIGTRSRASGLNNPARY